MADKKEKQKEKVRVELTPRDIQVCKTIKGLCDKRGWTAAHLTAALYDQGQEYSVRTVERWLECLNSPKADVILPLAKALEVDPNRLLGWVVTTIGGTPQ